MVLWNVQDLKLNVHPSPAPIYHVWPRTNQSFKADRSSQILLFSCCQRWKFQGEVISEDFHSGRTRGRGGTGMESCLASHLMVTVCSLLPRISQVQLAGKLRLSRPRGLCKVPCTSKRTAGGASQAGGRKAGILVQSPLTSHSSPAVWLPRPSRRTGGPPYTQVPQLELTDPSLPLHTLHSFIINISITNNVEVDCVPTTGPGGAGNTVSTLRKVIC
jgi:hypothetical protein